MSEITVEFLSDLIIKKLNSVKMDLIDQYSKEDDLKIRTFYVDNLLPEELAKRAFNCFDLDGPNWRKMSSFREQKQTSKKFESFDSILKNVTFALQDQRVLDCISEITSMKNLKNDPSLYAGGLSYMKNGDFLKHHIDNSHDMNRKYYRRLNLLYYVTPNWDISSGGNLSLYNSLNKEKKIIHSKFNRLVVMETHPLSYHGVTKIVSSRKVARCCISNYYFSKESPAEENYYHITSFIDEEAGFPSRLKFKLDTLLRNIIRKVKPSGFAKKDIYESSYKK